MEKKCTKSHQGHRCGLEAGHTGWHRHVDRTGTIFEWVLKADRPHEEIDW